MPVRQVAIPRDRARKEGEGKELMGEQGRNRLGPNHRIKVECLPTPKDSMSPLPGAAETIRGLLGQEHKKQSGTLNNLFFVQQNLHKGRPATNEMNTITYDFALVQEPSIERGTKVGLLQAPRRSFCLKQARAAVLVGEHQNYWPVESLSTRDLAVVALELEGKVNTLFVASCYLDILLDIPTPELERLVNHCKSKRIPLIIGMDSNAHSPAWGEKESNRRGDLLYEWIVAQDLHLANRGSTATFIPENGSRSTIIDLTLMNRWAIHLVRDWKVKDDDEPSFSDHRRITFRCLADRECKDIRSRSLKKAEWSRYRKELGKMRAPLLGAETPGINEVADQLTDNLTYVLDLIAPKRTRTFKENKWWTEALNKKRKILKNVYKKRHLHENVRKKYQELKAELSREIRAAKEKSWREFCTKAESARDLSRLIQIMDNPPQKQMSLLTEDGDTLNPQESLEYLLRTHFPDGKLGSERHGPTGIHDEDLSGIGQFITPEKVKAALDSFGDYKSPGPDELPPIVLKNMDESHLEAVSLLYKKSIATGQIPKSWQDMRVVFIPKAGKSDYSLAKAYRPITLSNFLLKGLERIIQWYILEYVLKEQLFQQHAYTKGRSCDTALSEFIDDAEGAIYRGEYLLAASLDCSGAFDCIRFDAAEKAMSRKGVPRNIVTWYNNLLRGRRVFADMQGCQACILPARGSPQGGVLSPLVWNMIMDTFLTQFRNGPVRIIGYADDILLYVKGKDPSTLSCLLQPALNKAVNWGAANGLTFNPAKTSTVLFTRRKRRNIRISKLRLAGVALEWSSSFRYLGVEIHQRLSWANHITERTNKCKYLLAKGRSVISHSWGLTPARMEWVYKAIIRPKLTYGAMVWAGGLTKGLEGKMRKVQRLALLAITHPLRSAPTAGLEVMMGWQPLPLHAKEIGLNTYLRISKQGVNIRGGLAHGRHIKGHLEFWRRMESTILHQGYPLEKRVNKHIWKCGKEKAEEEREVPNTHISVHTDASKKGEDVGMGWVVSEEDFILAEGHTPGKGMNVYTAEMMAVSYALEWLKDNLLGRYTITLLCDNRGVVTVVNGNKATSELVANILSLLRDLKGKHTMNIGWVKGHSKTTGNEYADILARMGREQAKDLSFAAPYVPLGVKEYKNKIHERFLQLWQEQWKQTKTCHITRLFYPNVRESKQMVTYTIKDLQRLSQLVTGHGLFKRHLRHWNELSSFECELCGEAWEDTWHLWNLCPRLDREREVITHRYQGSKLFEKGILELFKTEVIKELMATNESKITPT